MMKIRKATIEDYEKLKKFKLLSKKEELRYSETIKPLNETKDKYLEWLKIDLQRQWRAFFIAEDKGDLLGFIQAKKYKTISISKYEWKGYISNLFVDKKARGKGIAIKLIKRALKWLKDNNVPHASVEIHSKNTAAQSLVRKLGFKDYTIKLTKEI